MHGVLLGYWRIGGDGFLVLHPEGIGELCVDGHTANLDYHWSEREGQPAIEFSWEGDDMPRFGRGWAWIESDDRLRAVIYIHGGTEFRFTAACAQPSAVSDPAEPQRNARRRPRR